MQTELFSEADMVSSELLPAAPQLRPHFDWPFPGMSAEDSARKALSLSSTYADLLAAIVKRQGRAVLTNNQVLALVPEDWKTLLGQFAHAGLTADQGASRGVFVKFTNHDGGSGFHFSYEVMA